MNRINWIIVYVCCLGLNACALQETRLIEPSPKVVIVEQRMGEAKPPLDDLLAFTQYYVGLPASEQEKECNQVKSIAGATGEPIDRLRLAMVVAVQSPCENFDQAVDLYKELLHEPTLAAELVNFCAHQLLQLKEIRTLREERTQLQAQIKTVTASRTELQEKLDALTTIEKSINERKGIAEVID